MRKVIDVSTDEKESGKPVEFTHFLYGKQGWVTSNAVFSLFNKIIYLGKDRDDGDLFAAYNGKDAAYNGKDILIYKGHLNSGTY